MKRITKSKGSGGRLRVGLLVAIATALLLVSATSAFAAAIPAEIVGSGSGSGWVKGNEGVSNGHVEGGEPLVNCHWNGHEFDTAIPVGSGKCQTMAQETVAGVGESLRVGHEADLGSLFEGWKVLEGIPTGCEQENPGAGECIAAVFGPSGSIKIEVKFGEEPTPPKNITPPTISGTAKIGKTLKGNPGTWEGKPETFSYKWLRCDELGASCVAISGAEGTEYVVTEEDAEHTLRFEETAKNGLGEASATSAQTAVVPKPGGNGEASIPSLVYGEVEQTTSLESACEEVFLGIFLPGVEHEYENSCTVIATSTGQESALSAADEGAVAVGHLVNGSYSLAQALQVQGTDTESLGGVSTGFGTVAAGPYTLLNWAVPVSADTVKVDFKQPIGKHDPLHTGTYAKTITLTLKQTLP